MTTYPKRPTRKTGIGKMTGGAVVPGDIHCADFVAGNKTIFYGYTARDLDRLIDKVLAFLSAGATFLPSGDALRAELKGETLTFRSGAIRQLAGRRDERAYLLSLTVRRDYQTWATKFIPPAAQMDQPRVIAGLELPVAYTEVRLSRAGAGPDARSETVPLADITEALDKHQAFVILGEPGAGKTTTLQKIAFESARKLLSGAPARLPLFVRLSQQAQHTPFEFLQAEWEQHTGTDFADALAAGHVLVLADGINEMPRDARERDARLKAWREFVKDNGETNQIIFTSRERDYDAQLNLPRVRVEPLDDARIADYLQRNDVNGLAKYLDDPRSRLREMAGNPFNLWLLTLKYKADQTGLANRGYLMAWFVECLLKREKDQAHEDWLHRQAQITALAQLAYTMQQQGQGLVFPLKVATAAMPATVDLAGEDIAIKPATLFRLARAATLLDPNITPEVRFYHHLLQEYFAALELLRRFEAGEDLGGLWKCKRRADEMPASDVGEWDALPEPPATGWEVTTILACGLARDPARLIEAVRPHNPVLAGRMLDEAGIAKPEAVTKQVRADLLADLYNPTVHLRARLQAGFTLGCLGDPRFEPQTINGVKVIVPQVVQVPAGKYIIGDDFSQFDNEKPQREIELPAFAIGKWSVTNAEYACFIEAGGYKDERYWKTNLAKRWLKGEDVAGGQLTSWLDIWKTLRATPNWKEVLAGSGSFRPSDLEYYEHIAALSEEEYRKELSGQLSSKSRERPEYWFNAERNNPSQPVVGITWFEANAYCAWLTERLQVSGFTLQVWRNGQLETFNLKPETFLVRLPTEVEWEAAARSADGRGYPWGNEWDVARANTIEGRVLKPSPVGAYSAVGGVGESGAEDQCGNVWDWTSTLYREYPYQADDRENPESEGERVLRGGAWLRASLLARCACRSRFGPVRFGDSIAFRLCSPGSIPAS